MAESSSLISTLDPAAVKEAIEERVAQPNGTVISDRYRIEGVLGSGGMGTVYLVQHTHMRKRFALKMLHAETSQVPELVARFEREAVAMSRAEHPNIATATDFGRAEDGAFFLVLEYLEGYSLRDAFKQGPLDVRRVVHIGRQIASALERSHELGIIHRDLKPENIMLAPKQGDFDFVKILDFGLAKLAPEALEDIDGAGADRSITRHGSVFGTPRYMAPEQCVGQQVDGRADLYALGLILYEALTGLHPFDERDPRRMISHQILTPIPPMKVRAPGVPIPASLEALVMRATDKTRGQRHASATELLAELHAVCEREGILPPEPALRPTAQLMATPVPGPGVRQPSPLPRGLPSEDLPTQDAPMAGETQDEVHDSDATQAMSSSEAVRPILLPPDELTPTPAVALPDSVATKQLQTALAEAVYAPEPSFAGFLQRPRHRERQALVVLGLLAALGIMLGLFLPRKTPGPTPAASGPPGLPRPSTEGSPATPVPSSALVTPAELDKASAAGPSALLQLFQTHPTDVRLPRALAQFYVARDNGLDALRWQVKALALAESSVYDGEILRAATLAMANGDATEPAIALLAHDFGTRGLDVLIALMNKLGPGYAKNRISQSLTKAEVRALASPAALIALDLGTATRCEVKYALLSRAAREGDQRTLQQLNALTWTRGCGVLRKFDCWLCLRKDAALRNATSAIAARTSLAH